MSKLLNILRHELQVSGIPATTIARVEHALVRQLGGAEHYLPRIMPEVRNARRSLVAAGIPARTARWKVVP